MTQTAGSLTTVRGAVGLCGILEQQYTMAVGHGAERFDRAGLAVKVDSQDGCRPRPDRRLDELRRRSGRYPIHIYK